MKTDNSGIDREALDRLLETEYHLETASLSFLPKGEEAYCYRVEGPDRRPHFVRAQRAPRASDWERVFVITTALREECGLWQVVAPYRNGRGTFTCSDGGYLVAVFPFVEGRSAYEVELPDEGLAQAASLLARVHQCGGSISVPDIPHERFANPFEPPILQALRAAEGRDVGSATQRELRRRLRAEQAEILATLEKMKQLQAEARRLDHEWVLTHGDPNLDNFLLDRHGVLHLTDWGEVAFGPPERDLFAFTGERFEPFVDAYARAWKRPRLHRELFAFYFYRWCLQEIADYTTRLLFADPRPDEEAHAWAELQPYLPIPHEGIALGLRKLEPFTG
jgi:hypothetical protein